VLKSLLISLHFYKRLFHLNGVGVAYEHFSHNAIGLCLDEVLHLHGLDSHQGVTFLHDIASFGEDLDNATGHGANDARVAAANGSGITFDKFIVFGFKFQWLVFVAKHRDLIVLVDVVVYVGLVALVNQDQVIGVHWVEFALHVHSKRVHVTIHIFHVDIELVFIEVLNKRVNFLAILLCQDQVSW